MAGLRGDFGVNRASELVDHLRVEHVSGVHSLLRFSARLRVVQSVTRLLAVTCTRLWRVQRELFQRSHRLLEKVVDLRA